MATFLDVLVKNHPFTARFSSQDGTSSIPWKVYEKIGKPPVRIYTDAPFVVEAELEIPNCKKFTTNFRVYKELNEVVIGMYDARNVGLVLDLARGCYQVRPFPYHSIIPFSPENHWKILPNTKELKNKAVGTTTVSYIPKGRNGHGHDKYGNRAGQQFPSSVHHGRDRHYESRKNTASESREKDKSFATAPDKQTKVISNPKRKQHSSPRDVDITQKPKRQKAGNQKSFQINLPLSFPTPPAEDQYEDSRDLVTPPQTEDNISSSLDSQQSDWDVEPQCHLDYECNED